MACWLSTIFWLVRSIFSSRSCTLYFTVKRPIAVATAAIDQNTSPRWIMTAGARNRPSTMVLQSIRPREAKVPIATRSTKTK